ncbi:RNA-directed DNA polymerase from mobile element jockey-like [Mucor ambiguus]|uniref:RNA-directed DNA polymerase from mobile element jockey-like n=1 Tax=Mucor ambiguus TaxID=91626 RepID=A0A0C9N9H7_9FUNG|nr:RNA-directed DNA polymerase from mobile element jockey-like [Mucor ambiguus]
MTWNIIQTIANIKTLESYTQIEEIGKQINDAIYFSLDTSVTKSSLRPKHWKWFWTQELEDLAEEKKTQHIKWRKSLRYHDDLRSATLWKQYDKLNQKFKTKLSQHRSSLWKQFCDELKTTDKNNINRYIKRRFKSTSNNTQYTSSAGPQQAVEDIKCHLETVFSGSHPSIRSPTTGFPYLESAPTITKFDPTQIYYAILKELPSRKAPGSDHITAEMLRPIAFPLSKVLAPFLNLCYRHSWIPLPWRTAQVVPIYKKDNPNNPANYRPISLTSTFRKLLERILLPDLLSNMHALDIAQGGFRRQRGVIDQAFNLHSLIQQYRNQYNQTPTLAFLDIKAAYDSVNRDFIWTTLRPQLPQRLYLLIKHMFDDIQLSVISKNYESTFIYPRKGVLQGSILSPMLYAVFINSLPKVFRIGCTQPLLIRTLKEPRSPHTEDGILSIQRKSRRDKRLDTNITVMNSLLYADDVALIGSPFDIVNMLRRAEQHSTQHQYKWHPSKSIVINASSSFRYSLYDQSLTIAPSFNYLGIPFNEFGIQQDALLQHNINKATLKMQQLRYFGVHMYSLGLLIATSAYSQFIRPILEFDTTKPPTSIIEHITTLPKMTTRHQLLQFRFLVRIHSLPPGLLTANILNSCLGKGTLHKYWKTMLKKNTLWTNLLTTTTITNLNLDPPDPTEIYNISKQYKQDQHQQRQDAPNLQLIKQCRRAVNNNPRTDPILFIPCTSKERHRLIKWRMGWLIPKSSTPVACPYLLLKTHVNNYTRPQLPATEIDYLLNQLPGNFNTFKDQHWHHTWPVLNHILFQLDVYSHPSAIFDPEPPHGQLVFVSCSNTESSSPDISL